MKLAGHFVLLCTVFFTLLQFKYLLNHTTVYSHVCRKIFPEDFNPRCDLDSNQRLPQNTRARDGVHTTIPCLLSKVQKFRRQSVQLFLRISACTVTLTLRIATKSFQMTLQVMMIHQHTKFH